MNFQSLIFWNSYLLTSTYNISKNEKNPWPSLTHLPDSCRHWLLIPWIVGQVRHRTSYASDKLYGLLFLFETLVYFLSTKISPSAKKYSILCIKQTKCYMALRIKLKGFQEMVNEFRTKNMAWRLFAENYFVKQISRFSIYNIISKTMKKYHYAGLAFQL